jgi:4-diphosphocytidyl-2-C-methyl-D-erythritol kinase
MQNHITNQITPIDERRIRVRAPAKINLFLEVRGKRTDGYHELRSLMVGVGLCDTLTITRAAGTTCVLCSDPMVPEDDTNLAVRAASLFLKHLKRSEGFHIAIDKKIPVAAGLGGGSSDAAAVLLGLNHFYGFPFTRKALMAMGLEIGADVPFFVFGKPALAAGIGERLVAWENLAPYHVVLVYPGVSIATADVFKNLNLGLTKCEKALKHFPFRTKKFNISRHLCNDLETVTAARYPVIGEIKHQLTAQGAAGALMTGSGPTVFGLFADALSAERAVSSLARNRNWRLFLTDLLV